jgi:hypothetical protein
MHRGSVNHKSSRGDLALLPIPFPFPFPFDVLVLFMIVVFQDENYIPYMSSMLI